MVVLVPARLRVAFAAFYAAVPLLLMATVSRKRCAIEFGVCLIGGPTRGPIYIFCM